MKIAQGQVTVVQDRRFVLETGSGRGLCFTLARDANVAPTDLSRLVRGDEWVQVGYEGDPGLGSGIAHAIRPNPTAGTIAQLPQRVLFLSA